MGNCCSNPGPPAQSAQRGRARDPESRRPPTKSIELQVFESSTKREPKHHITANQHHVSAPTGDTPVSWAGFPKRENQKAPTRHASVEAERKRGKKDSSTHSVGDDFRNTSKYREAQRRTAQWVISQPEGPRPHDDIFEEERRALQRLYGSPLTDAFEANPPPGKAPRGEDWA